MLQVYKKFYGSLLYGIFWDYKKTDAVSFQVVYPKILRSDDQKMKVLKYFFLFAFLALFLKNNLKAESSRNIRQLSTMFTTRAPLINRVRERLTSILMHNHEHLAYLHQQYHQHHQNYLNVIHGHFQTTPMTPVPSFIGININSSRFDVILIVQNFKTCIFVATPIPETSSVSISTTLKTTEISTIKAETSTSSCNFFSLTN